MDALSITAIIVSLLTALKTFVTDVHLQKCHACCIDSDCRQNKRQSPPLTPINKEPAVLQLSDV